VGTHLASGAGGKRQKRQGGVLQHCGKSEGESFSAALWKAFYRAAKARKRLFAKSGLHSPMLVSMLVKATRLTNSHTFFNCLWGKQE
jgi:hypothetical protein